MNVWWWIKPDEPKGWGESIWCLHLRFNGQEAAVQIKREPSREHFPRSGSADVFQWGNLTFLFTEMLQFIWKCFAPWHLNLRLHVAGNILRDWHQKPELWEKSIAMHHASSRYSWWRNVCVYNQLWEFIHRRGGIKTQRMERINARHERWQRGC